MKQYPLLALFVLLISACAVPGTFGGATPATTPPAATAAPRASATPWPSTPTITPTPQSAQPQPTAVPPFGICAPAGTPHDQSPAGTWTVSTCHELDPQKGTTNTLLTRTDGSAQYWYPSYLLDYLGRFDRDWYDDPRLRQEAFIPLAWTADERFLYLAAGPTGADTPFPSYDGLFRLDTQTGQFRATLRPAHGELRSAYHFSFSPGLTRLAYVNQAQGPLTVVLYDLATGGEERITLDARFRQAGRFLWSPNEQQLALAAFDPGKNGGSSLIVYDLAGMENETLLRDSADTYLPLEWTDAHTLYVEDSLGNRFTIDTISKEITPAP